MSGRWLCKKITLDSLHFMKLSSPTTPASQIWWVVGASNLSHNVRHYQVCQVWVVQFSLQLTAPTYVRMGYNGFNYDAARLGSAWVWAVHNCPPIRGQANTPTDEISNLKGQLLTVTAAGRPNFTWLASQATFKQETVVICLLQGVVTAYFSQLRRECRDDVSFFFFLNIKITSIIVL